MHRGQEEGRILYFSALKGHGIGCVCLIELHNYSSVYMYIYLFSSLYFFSLSPLSLFPSSLQDLQYDPEDNDDYTTPSDDAGKAILAAIQEEKRRR